MAIANKTALNEVVVWPFFLNSITGWIGFRLTYYTHLWNSDPKFIESEIFIW